MLRCQLKKNREAPRLDVAQLGYVGDRDAPVLAEVDRFDRPMPAVRFVVAHEAVDKRMDLDHKRFNEEQDRQDEEDRRRRMGTF